MPSITPSELPGGQEVGEGAPDRNTSRQEEASPAQRTGQVPTEDSKGALRDLKCSKEVIIMGMGWGYWTKESSG